MPGLDGTGRLFKPALPHLGEARCDVVRYPIAARTLEEHLAAVPLPDEPFALVAESFSGPLAITLAARRPSQLRALVLIATFARVPFTPLVRAMARTGWMLGAAPRAVTQWVLLGGGIDDSVSRLLVETLSTVPSATVSARLRLLAALDVPAAKCDVPVLVIEAKQDWLVPRSATRALAAGLHASLVSIDGPHLVLQRSPAAVTRAIDTFLDTH